MRTLLLSMLMIAVIGCSDDDSDDDSPTGPDKGSTGVLYGTVTVYDQHLRPTNDHSGAIVRYVDTEGKSYTDTSDPAGEWNLELPLGTYYIDTIYHPTLQTLAMGHSPSFGPVSPIDWLGRGRRQLMTATKFIPPTLDSTATISDVTVQETSSAGQHYLTVNFTIASWYSSNYIINVALLNTDGSTVASTVLGTTASDNKPNTLQAYVVTGLPSGSSVRGMTLRITLSSELSAEQMYSTTEGRYGVTYSKISPRNSVMSIIL